MEDIPSSQVIEKNSIPTLEECRVDRIPSATSQVVKKVIPENGDSISVVEGVPSPVRKQKENSIPTLEECRVDRILSATSQVVEKVIPENGDSISVVEGVPSPVRKQ